MSIILICRFQKNEGMMIKNFLSAFVLHFSAWVVSGRIHHLSIHNDNRKYIPLSSFGFYTGGNQTVTSVTFI